MRYWEGFMNWPKDDKWECEICGKTILIWGLPHALCRCANCHTQYRMINEKDERVTKPICQLKDEYFKPMKYLWNKYQLPTDEITEEQWNEGFREAKNEQL